MKARKTATAGAAPHSWELSTWPPEVWPHDTKRAQWLVRAYRKELVAAGALSRVGKTIIFLGTPYSQWLARRADRVVEFAGNNPNIAQHGTASAKRRAALRAATSAGPH